MTNTATTRINYRPQSQQSKPVVKNSRHQANNAYNDAINDRGRENDDPDLSLNQICTFQDGIYDPYQVSYLQQQNQEQLPYQVPQLYTIPQSLDLEQQPLIHYQYSWDFDEGFLSLYGNADADELDPTNNQDLVSKEAGTSDSQKKKSKRASLPLTRKLEIIDYWEKNKDLSFTDISKTFRIPRTTIIGVINSRTHTQRYIKAKSDSQAPTVRGSLRMVDSRSPTVEKILVKWIKDLKIRGVTTTDKKICTQAIEIHRLLSSLQDDRLSPCQFTTGWLKGFKTRYNYIMELKGEYPARSCLSSWSTKVIEWKLDQYDPNDIYNCGLTSMFLALAPASNIKSENPTITLPEVDNSSASILLGCNATGTHKLTPSVFFRQDSSTNDSYDDTNSNVGEFTGSSFETWLVRLDTSILRPVILLVDSIIWAIVNSGSTNLPHLQFVKVIAVPDGLSSMLPMSSKLMKEFKAIYHTFLFDIAPNMKASSTASHMSRLNLIQRAWAHVSNSIIIRRFQEFQEAAGIARGKSVRDVHLLEKDDESGREGLLKAIKGAFSDQGLPYFHYYTSQDGDTGPSTSIYAEIQSIIENKRLGSKGSDSKKHDNSDFNKRVASAYHKKPQLIDDIGCLQNLLFGSEHLDTAMWPINSQISL